MNANFLWNLHCARIISVELIKRELQFVSGAFWKTEQRDAGPNLWRHRLIFWSLEGSKTKLQTIMTFYHLRVVTFVSIAVTCFVIFHIRQHWHSFNITRLPTSAGLYQFTWCYSCRIQHSEGGETEPKLWSTLQQNIFPYQRKSLMMRPI